MSDHAGHLPEFAGKKAQIIVHRQEYEYATRIVSPRRPDEEPAVGQFHSWMYSRPNFEAPGLGIPHSMTRSATGELRSLIAIRDLMGDLGGRIFCGHDHGQFLDLKHLPEYYD